MESSSFTFRADARDPLAARIAAGDPSAPEELVRRYRTGLLRYARALLGSGVAAEDAVQAAFERAFVALGGYEAERIAALQLRPWLYRITLNVVRNAWRSGGREVVLAKPPESEEPRGADRADWLAALEALGRLSERQRVAVALRYLEDLSYAEISAATGWPQSTCKTSVRRGLRRLGALLCEEPGNREKRGAEDER
ncbi:RNA polymerase sigma factor [Rubrobacter radiotolerans]|nr:RNA polymerase sigma factor [Rubrobacter radiotolerans]MDX5895461.1 RNA polymerase sigma factor [Rubrobacter radiotolerans]SMC01522.1 RNA polymerase sigma-70 factor, ECF subfamily [Rubrobacter radiotolerans DSM 5868]